MIIPYNLSNSYVAVSYPTTTYDDLQWFLAEENVILERIDPDEFLNSAQDCSKFYINLVTRDFTQRQQITEFIDSNNLKRFSFFHKSATVLSKNVGAGVMLYPYVGIMTNSIVGNDVIAGGYVGIAHRAKIGLGSIIDSYAVVAGSSALGKYCHLHMRATVYDKINICDHVIVSAGSFIRKDIEEPGIYATIINQKMVKLDESKIIDNG
jgi:carbonic anhydrase/acetyltransferase-like protein (isoleucine patch superfamily)